MVCSAEILENRLRAPLWAHILYVFTKDTRILAGEEMRLGSASDFLLASWYDKTYSSE